MDVETERLVQKRLASIVKDKTLILITHRLSMLRMVDRVIVMDGGKVALDGPRDVVLKTLQERAGAGGAVRASAPAAAPAARRKPSIIVNTPTVKEA